MKKILHFNWLPNLLISFPSVHDVKSKNFARQTLKPFHSSCLNSQTLLNKIRLLSNHSSSARLYSFFFSNDFITFFFFSYQPQHKSKFECFSHYDKHRFFFRLIWKTLLTVITQNQKLIVGNGKKKVRLSKWRRFFHKKSTPTSHLYQG